MIKYKYGSSIYNIKVVNKVNNKKGNNNQKCNLLR